MSIVFLTATPGDDTTTVANTFTHLTSGFDYPTHMFRTNTDTSMPPIATDPATTTFTTDQGNTIKTSTTESTTFQSSDAAYTTINGAVNTTTSASYATDERIGYLNDYDDDVTTETPIGNDGVGGPIHDWWNAKLDYSMCGSLCLDC